MQNRTSQGNLDAFALKLNVNGGFGWVYQVGGSSASVGYGIALDADNDAYLAGYFEGTAEFNVPWGDGCRACWTTPTVDARGLSFQGIRRRSTILLAGS